MFRRCFLRLTIQLGKEEPNIHELRSRLVTMRKTPNTPAVALLDTEARLAILLSQTGFAEEQREALMRGEEIYDVLQDPDFGLPNSSRTAMRISLCTALRRCAAQLRDQEAVQLWTKRFDAQRRDFSPESFITNTSASAFTSGGTGETNASGSSSKQGGRSNIPNAPRMGMLGQADCDDEDDDDNNTNARSNNPLDDFKKKHALRRLQAQEERRARIAKGLPVDEEEKEPSESELGRQRILEMMQSGSLGQSADQTGASSMKRNMTPMQRMKHDMMVNDHPYVTAIFRKKPPPGPRWT